MSAKMIKKLDLNEVKFSSMNDTFCSIIHAIGNSLFSGIFFSSPLYNALFFFFKQVFDGFQNERVD
jgi:hypothetical protein